ncbi:MAG TPA: tail fiber domain-containing protein [Candidatus Udaeobacter sp.]
MKHQNLIHILIGIVCIGLLPRAEAVVPPPDGGYPGFNTAEGQNALFSLTTGQANTAVGWFSLFSNTTNSFNTATGVGALLFNTADENTAVGAAALLFNTIGTRNTAVGAAALLNNTEATENTATGAEALKNNTTGIVNTANGVSALATNTTGNGNTALGFLAGSNLTTGDNNIDIGNSGVPGESATTRIGSEFQTRTFISAIRGVTTGIADAVNVVIDSNGQLGTMSSSRRFKKEIKPMDNASETILTLNPVTFHYKSDGTGRPQFGLIAEEVAAANPDLVVRDADGEIYTVRYDAVNAMLLNEFLKEHRKNEEQGAAISRQQKQIEALTAGLQKVSAQLEASKPAPQLVNNP